MKRADIIGRLTDIRDELKTPEGAQVRAMPTGDQLAEVIDLMLELSENVVINNTYNSAAGDGPLVLPPTWVPITLANEGEVTGRGVILTIAGGIHSEQQLNGGEGRSWASEIAQVAQQLIPTARAVYQDNGASTIVWLRAEDDAQAMRRHLQSAGYFVDSVTTEYGVAM